MEELQAIPRKIWIVIGVFFLLVVITAYSQGKVAGINKCVSK